MMGTDELRHHFHVGPLFVPGQITLTYTHYDRMIVGGAMPAETALPLETIKPNGTKSFLERRELVAVNIGGAGEITVGETTYPLGTRDMLYVGMGETVRSPRRMRTRRPRSICFPPPPIATARRG